MSGGKVSKSDNGNTLPLKKVEEELVAINPTIFQGLNSSKKAEVIKTFSYAAIKFHSGPLPSPDTIKEYDEVYAGAAKLIFETFSNQSSHRMSMETTVINSQQRQSGRGQWFAFIIAILVLGASFVCIFTGHEVSGTILGTIDLVALVTVFIMGKQYQKQDLNKKRPKD